MNPETNPVEQILQDTFPNTDPITEPSDENPAVEPQQQTEPQAQPQTNRSDAAFARMRTELSKRNQQLQDINSVLQKQGYSSIEDFIAKQNAVQQPQPQQPTTPSESEKRIQALEKELSDFRREQQMSRLSNEVSNLVQKYNISRPDWDAFSAQIAQRGINPLDSNVSLETLYFQFNKDKIIEAEKQKWLADLQRNNNRIPATPPLGSPTRKTTVSIRDLASKLKSK